MSMSEYAEDLDRSSNKSAYRSAFNMGMQHFDRFSARWETMDMSYFLAMEGDHQHITKLIIALEWFHIQFKELLVDPNKKKRLIQTLQKIKYLENDWKKRKKTQPFVTPLELLEVCKEMYSYVWDAAHVLNLGLDLQRNISKKAEIERAFING